MPEGTEPAASKTPKVRTVRQKWLLFAIVAVLSLAADQATKIWARASLPVHGNGSGADGTCLIPEDLVARKCGATAVPVVSDVWEWRLSMNQGSAFGLFSSQGSGARIFLS